VLYVHTDYCNVLLASLPNSADHRGNFSTYSNSTSSIFYGPSNPSTYAVLVDGNRIYQKTGNISYKLNIFTIPPVAARVAVIYFTTKSCLHIVIDFLWLPEPHQNMPHLSPYHQPVLYSTKFCKSVEIWWKRANSTSWLKIVHSKENRGP